ncbi:uncharacterized protein PADG_02264 [Paracoccidioides brasiliensis Pb18]|uniref:Protein FAF1 n=1 Tax=Paracoccidioides brasiliensis (strain Pb18) TaxID=502780 RepID=C1G298_PARBD|nr:uncharacterized protein PADG_02264 [Paracoccidioides brasiliensis Pb18]EEH46114.2 hypothetical protein PADG_02264 [Paracoccidioides brasiliensis Pb18]ODH48592.1 hypothetical protein GX48_05242 [Paracoccidioides brasiliensis]
MLGKRKRDVTVVTRQAHNEEDSDEENPTSADEAQDILRKIFEAEFGPVEALVKPISTAPKESSYLSSAEEENDGEEEWEGLSDEANAVEQPAEVVEDTTSWNSRKDCVDKQAWKAFMTAKPPSSSGISKISSKNKLTAASGDTTDDLAMDAENLKNDLALQRLLKESHLLESADDLNPTGAKRHRAIDLRMQSAGAKTSLFTQAKMPMSHRKGIMGKASKKERARRREARENGIILEKPTFSTPGKNRSGSGRGSLSKRGIGGPAIGKFAGGTLRLSKKDISDIQGPRDGGLNRGRRRGRGSGGRK